MVALCLFTTLSGTLDKLDIYQPLVLDLKVLQQYHDGLAVTGFLFGLDTFLGNQVRGKILSGDRVSSLSTTLSRVHRVSMEVIFPLVYPLVLRILL